MQMNFGLAIGLKQLKDPDFPRDQFWIPKLLPHSEESLEADWIIMMDGHIR